ncbi:Transcription factor [Penicillium lagena]|uniref:Transcription factor n=1 Tax=Penicillium lagena TaxID=94218 RepID=UPI002542575E|nr:Transcription factor [Penicillium lagena]KAJ5612557.1 Transcription factor [Penicillium lagena]
MRADLSAPSSVAFHELASSEELRLEPDISLSIARQDILTISDVLKSLPAQPTCDMLLSQYFNSRYMVLGIVHYGKFRIEYENFWKHPQNASLGWLALLYAIMSMSTILNSKTKAPTAPSQQSMVSTKALQQMAAQCLVLGGYATAKEYALEALLLYLQSRFITQTNSNAQLWLELGTLIRLAFRMAYHRDPSQLTDMPEFEGEMRRRVWLHVFQIDALASFHMGLPSMIPTEYCDSQVPRNLYDTDLYVGMESLPPSRPHTELTPILYGVAKADVMGVFKKIVAHTQSLASPGYDETLALDREMKETYERTPDVLRRRDVCQSFMDSSDIILERCTIELLYLKGIVVLHRRYIRHEPENPTYELSRRFCLEAALEILARQADIHQATLPGGRLHEDRWMVTSLTVQDFLLAAMVVCLDLSVRMETLQEEDDQSFPSRKLHALQVSQKIWSANGSFPPQSRLASLALDWMIQKVKKVKVNPPTESPHVPDTDMYSFPGTELPYIETVSDMIDGTEALDWSFIDQFLQSPGVNSP